MSKKQNIYVITSIVLMFDQIIKLLIKSKLNLYQNITIIPSFFSILYVENTGAAFSILENHTFLITIISLIVVLILHLYIKKEKHIKRLSMIYLGLILGGTFGNLIDRLLYHKVIDYLSFNFFKYQFPIFNIADIAITIGVLLFILDIFIFERKGQNNA